MSKVRKNNGMDTSAILKKVILIICITAFYQGLHAQTEKNIALKANFIYGNILKHTTHLTNLVKGSVVGGEFDIEWQTMGEENWHQYFNFPQIGVGVVGLDLGNPEMLGQLAAVYPYLNFKLLDLKFMQLNLKGGAGMSFLNKTFNNTATDLNNLNTGNAAIGSVVNVYFAGGGSVEFPFGKAWSAYGAFNWNHASNGSFYQPNSGINMLNASVGIRYNPVWMMNYKPEIKGIPYMPQKFTLEVIASGGVRELYYRDNKMFPTGSLVVSLFRQIGNNLRLGLAVDNFYDGVYGSVFIARNNPLNTTKYGFTYITEDKLANKFRVGVSLQPELVFGKITAGIHFGMYLYNPIKNLEPYSEASVTTLNKPLIYSYNIEEESGWFYTRASLKYAFSKHLFASLGLKTHLQKAEFIEWGMGYRF